MKRIKFILLFISIVFILFETKSVAQSTDTSVVIKLNTAEPGIEISDLACGLSYETKDILPNMMGKYYFHPDNEKLIQMMKTLGIKHLRMGGNSVDASNIPLPSEKDIHTFFQFARKAGLTVVYSIRLENGDPEYARMVAKIINDNYKDLVESISIGNEPYYYEEKEIYLEKWGEIRNAVLSVYPDAVFNGPDTNPNLKRMKTLISNFGNPEGRLVQITQHNYAFGCSYENPGERTYIKLIPKDRAESRDRMLSPDAYKQYEGVLDKIEEATKGTDLSFRLSETNSYWYSGLREVSNSNASALWALDYLYWWITHGAAGLSFHTGDITGGVEMQPTFYATFVTSRKGYAAMPLAYGMKLFNLGSNGKVIPVEVTQIPDKQNIAAYATQNSNGDIFLTLINKQYKEKREEKISIQLDRSFKGNKLKSIALVAEDNDISKIAKVTLGGGEIEDDGRWEGKWEDLNATVIDKSTIGISIPSASALLIHFTK
jgi:hypothetical protein